LDGGDELLPGPLVPESGGLDAQALDWATVRLEHRAQGEAGLIPAKVFEHERSYLTALPAHLPRRTSSTGAGPTSMATPLRGITLGAGDGRAEVIDPGLQTGLIYQDRDAWSLSTGWCGCKNQRLQPARTAQATGTMRRDGGNAPRKRSPPGIGEAVGRI